VRLVIHGHIHRRFVIRAWRGSGTSVANPGSLGSSHGARAYHVFTSRGKQIDLEARRYDPASRAFVPWPDAPGAGPV
jgi:predicted phosphodiesterase